MIETHQIIVLGTLKYGDDKLIVNALSRTAGRVTLVVHVTHNQRAAVRHTLFQPLAVLETTWEANPRATMMKPKSARPAMQLLSMQGDPIKATVALFLAEFLNHATRTNFDGGLLYDYITYALAWFDAAERNFANFHLVFLMRLTRFLGIDPNLEGGKTRTTDRGLPYFDLQDGQFAGTVPDHKYYIGGREAEVLPLLLRMNFGTMQLFRLNGTQRSRILDMIVTYYRLHLPGIPELKSLEVLRAVFH